MMRDHYDYVLIDSRTGVSDTSGVCTVQMPDALIVCFTLNNQSIDGASAVVRSVLAQRTDMPVRVLPVPMRVENSEKDKVAARKAYARQNFSGLPNDRPDADLDAYWSDVEVLYWPYYAYDEILATFADHPGERHSILASAEQITRHLTAGDVEKFEPPSEAERRRVLEKFGRRAEGRAASALERFDVYLSYDRSDAPTVVRLAHLLKGAGVEPWLDTQQLTPGSDWMTEVRAGLDQSRTFAVLIGAAGLTSSHEQQLAGALERATQDSGFRVFPVLLPGGPELSSLPPALAMRTAVDLRGGIAPEAIEFFSRAVTGEPGRDPDRRVDPARDYATLRRRLDALSPRLDFVKAAAGWLGTSKSPGSRGTVNGVADQLQWDTKELRRELQQLAGHLDPSGNPEDLEWGWRGYGVLQERTSVLFGECMQLVGGFAIRREGLDQRVCELADKLLEQCSVIGGNRPYRFITVPAGGDLPPVSRVRGALPIRVPDWTVWTLPLVLHEFAGEVINEEPSWRSFLDGWVDTAGEGQRLARPQLMACLADALATWIGGPAYACATLLLTFAPDQGAWVGERARVILGTLALQERGAPAQTRIEEMRAAWDSALQHLSDARAVAEEVDAALATITDSLPRLVPPYAAYTGRDWAESDRIAREWTDRIQAGIPLDLQASTSSIRNLLNAAWLCRLTGGEDAAGELDAKLKAAHGDGFTRTGKPPSTPRDSRDPRP